MPRKRGSDVVTILSSKIVDKSDMVNIGIFLPSFVEYVLYCDSDALLGTNGFPTDGSDGVNFDKVLVLVLVLVIT